MTGKPCKQGHISGGVFHQDGAVTAFGQTCVPARRGIPRKRQLLRLPDFGTPHHWTERDAAAWKLVEARVRAAANAMTEITAIASTA